MDDHIQGSRYIAGGVAENTPLLRHLAVKFIHAPLISLAARHRYTDTTNGFRAYSRRFLTDRRVRPFRDVLSGYEMHYYLAIRAARLGFRVTELPVGGAIRPELSRRKSACRGQPPIVVDPAPHVRGSVSTRRRSDDNARAHRPHRFHRRQPGAPMGVRCAVQLIEHRRIARR